MALITTPTHEALSQRAAATIAAQLQHKPDSRLILSAGQTPLATYAELLRMQQAGQLDLGRATIFALDEWGNIPYTHPQSCQQTIFQALLEPAGMSADQFHALNGCASDPTAECQRYSLLLRDNGPIDLALLGLGTNGHIGFNEPAADLSPAAHVVTLAPSTVARCRAEFGDELASTWGMTLGMAEIMQARTLLLIASGTHKATAVRQMLNGRLSTHCPASLLLLHPRLTVILDEAAANEIEKEEMGLF